MGGWSGHRWGEATVAAVLSALGLYIVVAASAMPLGSLAVPGPGFFPLAIGVLLVAVAAVILAGLGLGVVHRGPVAPLGRETTITVLVLIAAALAFERAGAIATFAVLLAVLFRTFSRATWLKVALFGLVGAAAAWGFFVRVLGVNLPGPGF